MAQNTATEGPHGCTDCMVCFDDISEDVDGPYCSERHKQLNENRAPSENDYLTDEQQEANGRY
jgi:hypothetical protein